MSTLIYDTCHEWFAKAQNKFANCFIGQIVPGCLRRRSNFQVRYVLWFWFKLLLEFLQHGCPHVVVKGGQIWPVWRPGVLVNELLGSACRAIPFVQLRNSFLKVVSVYAN